MSLFKFGVPAVLIAVAVISAWWGWQPRDVGGPPVLASIQPDVRRLTAEVMPESAPVPVDEHGVLSGDAGEPVSGEARYRALDLSEEEIAALKRREALQQAANVRFNTTVATDNLQPGDVPAPIRALFKTMTLAPVVDVEGGREGYIDGMEIKQISATNPLAKAGFRSGDRLTSFDGVPLKDPAEIAWLFSGLDEEFEVCGQREGDRRCRLITLTEEG